jgi:Hypothetical glycosyl hydrolase family 15
MTDKELRDAAIQHLEKTTVGYINKHWTTPPVGTEWEQALTLLSQMFPVVTPPPTPVLLGINLPGKFHIWGGNEAEKMLECDLVVASTTANADPRIARQTNPGLIALSHPSLDTWNTDWRMRRGFAWTYGVGLEGGSEGGGPSYPSWPGVNDILTPNPMGTVRGFTSADEYCPRTACRYGLQNTSTSSFLSQAIFYAYKLGKFKELGYNGIWSDNLFPSDLIAADYAMGTTCASSVDHAAWDLGLVKITQFLRSQSGDKLLLGGNVIYRAKDTNLRAAINIALREEVNVVIDQGADSIWNDMQQMQAWFAVPSIDGQSKIAAINDAVAKTDLARQKFGLAIACCYGAVYCANVAQQNTDTYWPPEMYKNGQRGYLGKPTSPPVRTGNIFSRTFEHGSVSANRDTMQATFT